MAVRAHDIALRHLLQDAFDARSPDHPRDGVPLRLWVPVVEVHRARGESVAAVSTGPGTEAIQESGLSPPALALPLRFAGRVFEADGSLRVSPLRSDPMAVRADHIALGCFVQQHRRRPEHGAPGGQPEPLHRPVAVIEVHLVRGEGALAVRARPRSQLAKQFQRTVLPDANTVGLEGSVPPVVGDVGRPLTRVPHHSV